MILRPGDKIHVAMPCSAMKYGSEREDEFQALADEIRAVYGGFGIEVPYVSFNSALTAPVVVAVLSRNAEGECMQTLSGISGLVGQHDGCPCRKTGQHRIHRCEHGTEWWQPAPDAADGNGGR